MTKQKKSFMQKLVGSKSNQEDDSQPMHIEADNQEDIVIPENSSNEDLMQSEWENSENETDNDNDGEGQLTIDVYQTDDEIVIKSTIAGVKPEDLDVSINNDMVTIKGERKGEEEVVADNYYYQECYWGTFSRSVVLPVDVISDKIDASLKNGILTIKFPKAEKNKAKKIQVRGF